MVAQFSVKTTNSKKAIEFLSLMSCSIHKLKSLPCYSRSKIVYFRFYVKKNFVPGNGAPPAGWLLLPPPLSMALRYKVYLGKLFFFFGMTVLSSAVFHLQNRVSDFFAREIKSFYQISLGNEVDFWDIMNVSQISLLKIKILKN